MARVHRGAYWSWPFSTLMSISLMYNPVTSLSWVDLEGAE